VIYQRIPVSGYYELHRPGEWMHGRIGVITKYSAPAK
jgi:hypothetical protein